MKNFNQIKLFVLLVFVALSCKEKFTPELSSIQTNYLVVEGFINADGFTTIKLSRSTPLDSANLKSELNAQVTIVSDDNMVFNVTHRGSGTYTSDSLILNKSKKYQVRIKTASGGDYQSELSTVKTTPEIDSISWRAEDNGVRIFVSSHDQQNNSRYYKWDYQEDWEIHSNYENRFEYKNGVIIERSLADIPKFYTCWCTVKSPNILLGSSVQLASDVISLAPIVYIPIESEKLSVRYSILIKQTALDRRGYDFFKTMKSNTETLGSIFDPLPSDFTGNIVCLSNPAEKVIGYVSATTTTEKRIFITASEVNAQFRHLCQVYSVPNNPDSIKLFISNNLFPFDADDPITVYSFTNKNCIDCTTRGTNIKPSFW